MIIIELSKENLDLAIQEVISLTKDKEFKIYENLLVIEKPDVDLKNRLGMSHKVLDLFFICDNKDLLKKTEEFNWQNYYSGDICVRAHDGLPELELSDVILSKIEYPIVNLVDPKTKIEFFKKGETIICGLFLNEVDKTYLKRKAHLRPSLHPTSMHPKLARVCINLTGFTNGILLDPFCGSGGFLIEAGLMGFSVIGIDIDSLQIERAKKNLEHYGIKKYDLRLLDSTKSELKVDCIVTDLPYGKGSKGNNLQELYKNFLKNSINMTKNMVIVFPDFVDSKKIIEDSGWKIKNRFQNYVHKTLTRIIYKLSHV